MQDANQGQALLVDLYELTMAAGYFEHRVDCRATFELFVRQLPSQRRFLVAAGVEAALDYLENLQFTEGDVRYLRAQPAFKTVSDDFFDYLRKFRFSGDVNATPEGTLVFGDEPILQVSGPVLEAQIVETFLLSVINFETLIATKSARVVRAAGGRDVHEFGTRRAQGPEAGVRAARAAYVGGCAATSNVLAGARYGVPIVGTAAHSWTQVLPSEAERFEALLETFPGKAYLLIDTYDALEGARTATRLGQEIPGVRLDSGDLLQKSQEVRHILDQAGFRETRIMASGDLNEFKIESLVRDGAPIDSFGVGTDLATSRDVPALGVVYKLVETELAGRVEPKTKFSERKVYWPGRKQVLRFSREGMYDHDLIARPNEVYPDAAPILEPAMRGGHRVAPTLPISEIRARTLSNLDRLPGVYQSLHDAPVYPIEKSAALMRLLEEIREEIGPPREAAGAGKTF